MVIQSVRTGSFADLQGLEPGLVITRINKQPTGTKDQFDAVVGKLKTGDDVVFEVIDPRHPDNGINYLGGTLGVVPRPASQLAYGAPIANQRNRRVPKIIGSFATRATFFLSFSETGR